MTMSLFGHPTLPKDQFEFNQTQFFISFDKKEKITEWNYHGPDGQIDALEKAGGLIIGMSLNDAFSLSADFQGLAHGIFWQLGRLLGYWQQSHTYQFQNDLVCRCFGITRSEILKSVIQDSKTSLTEIGTATKAGLGCGQCHQDIAKTVQAYCDRQSFIVANKTKPLGLNPISLLRKLESFVEKWNKDQTEQLQLQLLGMKDYTVYAKWNESQDHLLEVLKEVILKEFELNLTWQQSSF